MTFVPSFAQITRLACQVILNIQRVEVKGYHECPFYVEVGERFVAQKKTGDLFILVALYQEVQLMMLEQDGVLEEGLTCP